MFISYSMLTLFATNIRCMQTALLSWGLARKSPHMLVLCLPLPTANPSQKGVLGFYLPFVSRQCHSFKYNSQRNDSKTSFLKPRFTSKFQNCISNKLLGFFMGYLSSISSCVPNKRHLLHLLLSLPPRGKILKFLCSLVLVRSPWCA